MAENTHWNKKIFALLLNEAKGVRSWRQFASDCGISYVQMRKLALATQENPPRPKLIRKVAEHAFGDIDLADLMFAAGMNTSEMSTYRAGGERESPLPEKYRALKPKDRRLAEKFIDFLNEEASKEE